MCRNMEAVVHVQRFFKRELGSAETAGVRLTVRLDGGPAVCNELLILYETSRMALSLKDKDPDSLARQVASLTGESLTEVVRGALRPRLRDEQLKRGERPWDEAKLDALIERGNAFPVSTPAPTTISCVTTGPVFPPDGDRQLGSDRHHLQGRCPGRRRPASGPARRAGCCRFGRPIGAAAVTRLGCHATYTRKIGRLHRGG